MTSSDYLDFAYQIYEELGATEVNLMYEGAVTQDITRNFTMMTEENMIRHNEASQVMRKVFNVMVESLQNISRHADVLDGDPTGEKRGIVLISHNDAEYHVVTGNAVLAERRSVIESRLTKVNSQDRNGLSEMYKKQIQEGQISEKGGAGLGFIDIAKKSGNKIDFRFEDIGEGYLFFITIARIPRVKAEKN